MIKSGHLQSNIKPGSLVRFKLDSDIGHIYQDKVGIVIRKFDPEDAMTCPEERLVYVYDILVNGTIRAFAPHEIELINKTTINYSQHKAVSLQTVFQTIHDWHVDDCLPVSQST